MFPTENNVQWQATQPSRLKLWNGYLARTSSQLKLGFLPESIVSILEQKTIFTESWDTGTNRNLIFIYFLTLWRKRSSFYDTLFALLKNHFSDVMLTLGYNLELCVRWRNQTWKLLRCVVMGHKKHQEPKRSLIADRVPCLHLSGRPAQQNVSSFNFIII